MTDDIAALKRQLTDAGLTHGPLHEALEELERTRAERKSYEELYADALADAKSDAQDFESDLWIEVRKFLTEINLDWRDYAEDGILAEQAVEYIRECMDEETRRAEAAEADRDRLAGELAEARAGLSQADIAAIEATGKRWHGEDHRVVSVRWEPYKPDGARQMKAKGRWQEQVGSGDYWRWQNCDRPSSLKGATP